jgi:hypothetical protein
MKGEFFVDIIEIGLYAAGATIIYRIFHSFYRKLRYKRLAKEAKRNPF